MSDAIMTTNKSQQPPVGDDELCEELAELLAAYDRSRAAPSGDAVDIEVNTINAMIKAIRTKYISRETVRAIIGEDLAPDVTTEIGNSGVEYQYDWSEPINSYKHDLRRELGLEVQS